MFGAERWRENWLVIGPPGAVRVDVQRSAAKRRALGQRLRDLPPGTPVVLCASAPGAIRRCRRFASAAAVELEREYLAFPSAAKPGYLVEDRPETVSAFARTILAPPPRAALAFPIEVGLSVIRALRSWRLIRLLAPGWVAVGSRR